MSFIDWTEIKEIQAKGCNTCGAPLGLIGVQYNGLKVWCVQCGWAKDWEEYKKAQTGTRENRHAVEPT